MPISKMPMRERMARAHFERDRAQLLQSLEHVNGTKAIRKWPASNRAEFRSIKRQAWETLQELDRYRYFDTADVALDCLTVPPTDAMVDAAQSEESDPLSRAAACRIFGAMIDAMIKEGT